MWNREQLAIAVGILVPVVWATSVITSIITGDIRIMVYVTPVILAEAGWLFGLAGLKLVKNGKNSS